MINLQNKLNGIPTIYYTNLDNRVDRREYMESQFKHWGIKNYNRISSSKYSSEEEYKWQHLVIDKSLSFGSAAVANSITHLEMIKNWLETTNEEYLIMMEDDYDLSLIEYWNFDWDYLMNNIPFDWDCIQLGFESFDIIPFFLHPKTSKTYFGACLINRYYAKKLIKLYCKNDKFIVDNESNNVGNLESKIANGTVDYSICSNGKTYCIPLIPQNPYYTSYENGSDRENEFLEHIFKTYDLYHYWWKNEHHKFSLEDFFKYNKKNDWQMTKSLNFESVKKKIRYS